MYHYLTGSASWLVLTQITAVFGVRGYYGDLILAPKLVREQFDPQGIAKMSFYFAAGRVAVEYHNPQRLDVGEYAIRQVHCNGCSIATAPIAQAEVLIKREIFTFPESVLKVFLDAA